MVSEASAGFTNGQGEDKIVNILSNEEMKKAEIEASAIADK